MKLISLNAYGGRLFEPVMEFVTRHKDDTDIFCFQEMYSNPQENIDVDRHKPRVNFFEELTHSLSTFAGHMAIAHDEYSSSANSWMEN